MRVAALYDIHGNLPALESVLDRIRRLGVDRLVIGGDVLPGPLPHECLALLQTCEIPLQCLLGNGETAVLQHLAGQEPSAVPPHSRALVAWAAQQLDERQRQWIAAWPRTLQLDIPGLGQVLFCHATPRNEIELFTALTPEDRLLPIFEPLGVPLIVCGHTHMQFNRTIGSTRVVNAGSVGMPFGEAGCDWLLLGPDVTFEHTAYDLSSAAERVRRTSYPQAETFAQTNILQPPAAADMLNASPRRN